MTLISFIHVALPTCLPKKWLKKAEHKSVCDDEAIFEYVDVKKKNGIEGEVNGYKIYELDFHPRKLRSRIYVNGGVPSPQIL